MYHLWILLIFHGWRGRSKNSLNLQNYSFSFSSFSECKEVKCHKIQRFWINISSTSPRILYGNFLERWKPSLKGTPNWGPVGKTGSFKGKWKGHERHAWCKTCVLSQAVETKIQFKETFGYWSGDMWVMNSYASARENSAFKFELQIYYAKESAPVLCLESARGAWMFQWKGHTEANYKAPKVAKTNINGAATRIPRSSR